MHSEIHASLHLTLNIIIVSYPTNKHLQWLYILYSLLAEAMLDVYGARCVSGCTPKEPGHPVLLLNCCYQSTTLTEHRLCVYSHPECLIMRYSYARPMQGGLFDHPEKPCLDISNFFLCYKLVRSKTFSEV